MNSVLHLGVQFSLNASSPNSLISVKHKLRVFMQVRKSALFNHQNAPKIVRRSGSVLWELTALPGPYSGTWEDRRREMGERKGMGCIALQ